MAEWPEEGGRNTFKSLASVWKKSNTQQVSMVRENELSGQMGVANNQTQQEDSLPETDQAQEYFRFSERLLSHRD